ncbi:MAG: hypothetical protein K2N70_05140 [Helicobacter sp.]|nr:hypothetical protein [Helicobacter sp.]
MAINEQRIPNKNPNTVDCHEAKASRNDKWLESHKILNTKTFRRPRRAVPQDCIAGGGTSL